MRNPRNDTVDADGNADTGPNGAERTCVLTRSKGERDQLIRLALGPDGQVHPDVRAKAPGRGAWIGVTRPVLETAIAKGRISADRDLRCAPLAPLLTAIDLPHLRLSLRPD